MWNIAFAENDRLKKRAAGKWKFFDPTIFQKCWRGVGEQPWSLPAGSEIPVPCFWHTEGVVRKATAFRGGANKTAPPCFSKVVNSNLAAVPVEQLQRLLYCFTWNTASRETTCVRFGRIASLSASVLFAGGCVVRIAHESFLDCSLQEFFMFLEWRTADCLFLLDFYYC